MIFAFEKLEVWHKAMELAESVYKVTQEFPANERFGITAQLKRAAVSIPSNIAEGKGRYHRKEFLQFLYGARGSLYETLTQLRLSLSLRYLQESQYQALLNQIQVVMSKLSGLINSLK